MRRASAVAVLVVLAFGLAAPLAEAQAPKKGARKSTGPQYRTLTGKVADVKKADARLTLTVADPAKGATKGDQAWVLGTGNQTLLLRAGRNGQYATIGFDDLKKGDTVQAVVALEADPADKAHVTWWLVQYPPGMTPPGR